MSDSSSGHTPMEGQGSYNRHALQQAAGGASILPLLEQTARHILLDTSCQPVVIADY